MGLDLQKPRKNHHDRNKWYKREYVNNMKLIPGAVVSGVFYSMDKDAVVSQTVFVGNIKKTMQTLTIVSHDNLDGLEVDDYIMFAGTNSLWIVDNIIQSTEGNGIGSRPAMMSEIIIRR